jgi:hypothetical protein
MRHRTDSHGGNQGGSPRTGCGLLNRALVRPLEFVTPMAKGSVWQNSPAVSQVPMTQEMLASFAPADPFRMGGVDTTGPSR